MNHAINLSKPKVIFVSPSNLNKIMDTAQKNSFVEHIILYDNSTDMAINSTKKPIPMSFTQIIETDSRPNDFKCEPQNVKEHVAAILCSSGIISFTLDIIKTIIAYTYHVRYDGPTKRCSIDSIQFFHRKRSIPVSQIVNKNNDSCK